MEEQGVVRGFIVAQVFDESGELKQRAEIHNLITDVGDNYNARRIAAGVLPAALADVPLLTGMKLGTGTTAASKNGAGAALGTYLSASNRPFDSAFPAVSSLGAGNGVNVVYQSTWPAGIATSSSIREIVLVTDSAANATTASGNTIARGVFPSNVVKGANDTLIITWNHKQQGA